MKNRTNLILELLSEVNKIEVSRLAEKLQVSQVTIRKDLDALESRGLIKREHGFASLLKNGEPNSRIAIHYEVKQRIAQKAAELISDGDTLMLGGGSCCTLLAEELVSSKKELTIVTNSLFLSEYIRSKSSSQIILLGGILQQDSQILVGPMVRQGAENFCVDFLFTGCDGYSPATGFTGPDQMLVQSVRDMASQSENVVILAESGKFSRHGVVPLHLENKIHMVITDSALSRTIADQLKKDSVEICTV